MNPAINQNNSVTSANERHLCTSNFEIQNEHKLQYFDLDVANPPAVNRRNNSIGNLLMPATNRLGILADLQIRVPIKSGVVYNSVDFVKTEAFKRIREERKKENENANKEFMDISK